MELLPNLSLKLNVPTAAEISHCHQPPSWPPLPDWVISLNANCNPVSKWGDAVWDFSAWAGKVFKLYFAKQPRTADSGLGQQNQNVLRMCMSWLIWGPQGYTSWQTLKNDFNTFRRVVLLCEKNGIVASDLARFPQVVRLIGATIKRKSHRDNLLVILDRLFRAREELDFTLLDESGMRSLAEEFSITKHRDIVQTAYIPPRIWVYQVTRLREGLDDFLVHQKAVENFYEFCLGAYTRNYELLAAAGAPIRDVSPFTLTRRKPAREYHGSFEENAKRFGIDLLLRKWVATDRGHLNISQLSTYFSLVQFAGLAYIANFTLQRSEEFAGLRSDCLIWEEDPTFGRIPTICGETTKTDPDSDARWPTSPSVEVAVNALTQVATMRVNAALASPEVNWTADDVKNPFLLSGANEPWAQGDQDRDYAVRPLLARYWVAIRRFPRLFDREALRITQEDYETARLFTPNLGESPKFKVGEIWPLAFHQLRRTGAINMFASGILSDTSIQFLMKHLTLLQTRYYGKNFSRLKFNSEWDGMTVTARYEVMAKQLQAITDERYVSPYGEERKKQIVLDFVGAKDFASLVKEGQKGNVSFRAIRLGGCTNREHCEYGGIESISRCAGGDGGKPCHQVVYDKRKRSSAERQLKSVEQKIVSAEANSPRARALQAEAQGLRNFLHDTKH
ncbi:hypothetical protein B0G75_103552 [Paraburkholderia sp. BL18I3N2]|uniref:hypothetical protein n=1 Tax=Paraburkholderia sp. BL18I3N2 TaxID=1938799 RepID=UPI000D060997|nr:hypothetical protein [Paraburkholderia sp. BL18I3N2]PRX33324.1 hypothetical protein B0G75_103552 [Paraburkholderia sp. BL18I3N2]